MSLKLLMSRLMHDTTDKDMSPRYHTLDFLQKVAEGRQYDNLVYPFYQGITETGDYIPLHHRVPSIQAGFCEVIIHDSTSLLFSQSHFPAAVCDNKKIQQTLSQIIEDTGLQAIMLQAARMGSVGSVAIEVMVLDSKLIICPMLTKTLTPTFDPRNPKKLIKVTQKYKATGKDLKDSALYSGVDLEDKAQYWVQAIWDENEYTHYQPQEVGGDDNIKPTINTNLSFRHGIGQVPIVWIRNLCGFDPCAIDGAPTVSVGAARIAIEIDYQLSQAGRALTYSSDPITVIKEGEDSGAYEEDGSFIRTSENVIRLDSQGDAKMLEIDGKASEAVLLFVKELRERFMELVRGNRTSPDKLAAATSGYAIELMNMALTNLVKEFRVQYGNEGLVEVLKLILVMASKVDIMVLGKRLKNVKLTAPIRLKWADFYEETESDRSLKAGTLVTLTSASLLPIEDAREEANAIYGITIQDAMDDENASSDDKTYVPLPEASAPGNGDNKSVPTAKPAAANPPKNTSKNTDK